MVDRSPETTKMHRAASDFHEGEATKYRDRILKDAYTADGVKNHPDYPKYKFHTDAATYHAHRHTQLVNGDWVDESTEDGIGDMETPDFDAEMETLLHDRLADQSATVASSILESARGHGYHPSNPKIDYFDKDGKYIASTNWSPTHRDAGEHKPEGAIFTATSKRDGSKLRKIKA